MVQSLDKSVCAQARAPPPNIATCQINLPSTTTTTTMPRQFSSEITGNRGKKQELLSKARSSIISKWEAGVMNKDLAAKYGVHRNVIAYTIKRWKEHHTVNSLPRSSRPQTTTRREQRLLVRLVRRYLKIKYRVLMQEAGFLNTHHPPSKKTVARILKRHGLTNHRCALRPKFNKGVAALRLRFAREYRHFN
jgi:transposase